MDLTFNFIGVSVVDWHSAFRFFSGTLGIKAELNPAHGDWAVLGGAWEAYYKDGSRSAVFELFDHGRAVPERHWGLNQGIRPGFHVSNIQKTIESLSKEIPVGDILNHPWGKTAEITTPEGIRFAFAEIPNTPLVMFLDLPSQIPGQIMLSLLKKMDILRSFWSVAENHP